MTGDKKHETRELKTELILDTACSFQEIGSTCTVYQGMRFKINTLQYNSKCALELTVRQMYFFTK